MFSAIDYGVTAMPDVFISYAREDLERVRAIVGVIEAAGYSVFWDRDVPPGMTWRQYIGKALEEAKCVIVVWSKHSIESDWVMEEADDGRQRRILVPLTIENVVPPLGFRAIQHENLSNWDGDPDHRGISRLLHSIQGITGKAPEEKPQIEAVREESPPIPKPISRKQTQAYKKPASKLETSFFFKLGPMVVSLTFATLFLVVGLNFWFGDQRKPATSPVTKPSPAPARAKKTSDSVSKGEIPSAKTEEKASEKAEEKTSDIPQSFTNSLEMEFVLIPPGTFMMGSDERPQEQPIHRITISKPFYMQTTEVTQGQWREVMNENPSKFQDCDSCPVEMVSWDDIRTFLEKLNLMEDGEYRLPTEAEWEYAARCGGKEETHSGGENLDEIGWYVGNSGARTRPVAKKKPNALGLFDMSGNVWEWVEDDWHANYYGAPVDGRAWADNLRSNARVIRGGSWGNLAKRCRSASRDSYHSGSRYGSQGFRLARSVAPGP